MIGIHEHKFIEHLLCAETVLGPDAIAIKKMDQVSALLGLTVQRERANNEWTSKYFIRQCEVQCQG